MEAWEVPSGKVGNGFGFVYVVLKVYEYENEKMIRKLYVNGQNIRIEFSFAYFKFWRSQDAQLSLDVVFLLRFLH